MNNFRLPYHLIVQEGIFEHVDEVMADCVQDIKNKKVIIVTDANLQKLFGDIIEALQHDFEKSEVYLVQNNYFEDAVALAKYACMNNINVIIGFGGGTVLDLAKYAAFVSKAMYLCLPTTLSNDSLASPVAVLGTEGKARKTFNCTIPDAIIVDVNVITGAPDRQLLAGIGDTISKYTALNDWKLAHTVGNSKVDDFAYMISKMAFNTICYSEPMELKSKDFIKLLTQALVMGGLAMEIAGDSRPASGSEHLFSHALDYYCHSQNLHGFQVALGAIAVLKLIDEDYSELTSCLEKFDININPSALNIDADSFVECMQNAVNMRSNRYTYLHEIDLGRERILKVYNELLSEL